MPAQRFFAQAWVSSAPVAVTSPQPQPARRTTPIDSKAPTRPNKVAFPIPTLPRPNQDHQGT